MSESCAWLHEQLEFLPLIRFPFVLEKLPEDGIYFFYEDGEICNHVDCILRIVRVGTSNDRNFRSRIAEHFLLDEARMSFDVTRPAPKDRSIFRKNIGRALLNREYDPYLRIWNIDFTRVANREKHKHLRNIPKEKQTEREITRILREDFSFRFIIISNQTQRKGLERSLIGAIGRCELCQSSGNWLGKYSPEERIQRSGLWQVHHLNAPDIDGPNKKTLVEAIARTAGWITHNQKTNL